VVGVLNCHTPPRLIPPSGDNELSSSLISAPDATANSGADALLPPESSPYGLPFWLCYISNLTTVIAMSMMVRYVDFIKHLGGNDVDLGIVVGAAAVGSLLTRLPLGVGIDHYGPRRIWLFSLVLLGACLLAHLLVAESMLPLYPLRMLMATAVAGVFGANVTFAISLVPQNRIAEMVAMVGTSGFIGMFIGPFLADYLCGQTATVSRDRLNLLFMVPAFFCLIAFLSAWGATFRQPKRKQAKLDPPKVIFQRTLFAIRNYTWFPLLILGIAISCGLNLPGTFVRAFAIEHSLGQIFWFFAAYAVAAFLWRLKARKVLQKDRPERLIPPATVALAAGILMLLFVNSSWMLIFPGIVMGSAHAFLFPTLVAALSSRFPQEYRGLGTTLAMTTFDIGALLGAPALSGVLFSARSLGLPAYPTMFIAASAGTLLFLLAFLAFTKYHALGKLIPAVFDSAPKMASDKAGELPVALCPAVADGDEVVEIDVPLRA
jgi:MFS family permease